MLLVISPAKNLDYQSPLPTRRSTQPKHLSEASLLVEQLREMAPHELSRLMGISDKLGVLNYDRYQAWAPPFDAGNSRPAVLAFNGDVYTGLDARQLGDEDLRYAQKHLRILSGLYGVLRPLDLMQPYRLEMGTRMRNSRGANLYEFWGDLISDDLNAQLAALKSRTLVNLASKEYFKSVCPERLKADVITPVFKERRADGYRMISFFAKRARGLMCRYVLINRVTKVRQLQKFNLDGYRYNPELSSPRELVFTREER